METLIPKKIHQIWLGSEPMPEQFKRYAEGWKQLHAGWEYHLWTSDNLPPLVNQKEFDESPTWAGKSDIARMELVEMFGGLYIDTDFECCRNIELLLANTACVIALEPQALYPSKTNLAFFAAEPNYSFLKKLIAAVPDSMRDMAARGPCWQAGPDFVDGMVLKEPKGTVTLLHPDRVHPYGPFEKHREKETFPNAFAIHRWSNTWMSESCFVSFVIVCDSHSQELRDTLDTLVAFPGGKVVVLGWNSHPELGTWLHEYRPKVRLLKINTHDPLNEGYARNIAAGLAGGNWLCFVRPGTELVTPSFLTSLKTGSYYTDTVLSPGFLVCEQERFAALGGYDDILEDFPSQDADLCKSLQTLGTTEMRAVFTAFRGKREFDSPCYSSNTGEIYSLIKRDIMTLNKVPHIERFFRKALHESVDNFKRPGGSNDVEVSLAPLHVSTETDKKSICRTMRYVVK